MFTSCGSFVTISRSAMLKPIFSGHNKQAAITVDDLDIRVSGTIYEIEEFIVLHVGIDYKYTLTNLNLIFIFSLIK